MPLGELNRFHLIADELEREDIEDTELSVNGTALVGESNLLDNGLAGGSNANFPSKVARINSECEDAALHENCVPGQKWKCINEDGRWRKHKCKFHVSGLRISLNLVNQRLLVFQLQMLHHLEKITKEPNRRNCACFVAKGVVYTKLKAPGQKKHQGEERPVRHKRETADWDDALEGESIVINQRTPLGIVKLIQLNEDLDKVSRSDESGRRHKRSTENVTSAIAEIQRSLDSLEDSFRNGTTQERCYVESTGSVNCSSSVYEDEKSWKRNRNQIELLIRMLKKKISDLKDIRKHLKEHKPTGIKEDYEDSVASKEEEDEKRDNGRKADPKEVEDELGPFIDMDWYTSTTETIEEDVSTTTASISSATVSTTRAPKPSSIFPGNRRKPVKRPHNPTTVEPPPSTSQKEDDTKIPIFYIGEDKAEPPVKPNVTTEEPEADEVTISSTASSTTEMTSPVSQEWSSTTTTAASLDLGKSVHVETTIFQPNTPKPHRHSHGAHGNRSQHHENRKNSDTTSAPAECYCDLENEK